MEQKNEGLNFEKLIALTGKKDLTTEQAEETINSLKILVEIILDFQQEQEILNKSKNLNHLLKHAA